MSGRLEKNMSFASERKRPVNAIILAAGVGKRLGDVSGDRRPKCLLEIDGKSLLQRHLELLDEAGIEKVVLVLGYESERIQSAIEKMPLKPRLEIIHNPDFTEGSIVSLWAANDFLASGPDVLLMDADVLYDRRMLERLTTTSHPNCFLLDQDFEPGVEPVKLCVADGELVEFRKRIDEELAFDLQGESVGFFRFSSDAAVHLAEIVQSYIEQGRQNEPHEEAIRDFLLESPAGYFNYEDVTGLPWIEIDFPEDIKRAEMEILPNLV